MASKLLKDKPEAEILAPEPIAFTWKGKPYEIYPLPDSALMRVGDSLSDITRLFDTVAQIDINGRKFSELGQLEMVQILAPLVPQIVRLLLPNASRLIAACLRIDETAVAEEMRLADKLEALSAIVKQEDLPRIVANFLSLTEAFVIPSATTETA